MKILYDHQIFSMQKYGGISRYFAQIMTNLPEEFQFEITAKYTNNEYIKGINLTNEFEKTYNSIDKFLPGINFRGKGRLFNYAKRLNNSKYIDWYEFNRNLSIEMLKKQDFDVFHPTYYDDYFLEYLGNKPFVLTIHDMIHELYPELLNDFGTSSRKARLASKADHIIAISENTKKDIIEILGIPETKISVVYHANSLVDVTLEELQLPSNYILFVGERTIYKNFMFFVRAIYPILKADSKLFLVCTGNAFSTMELELLNGLGIIDQVITKNVNDSELAQVYKKAIVLIFPSYYEGFGIPILEAWAMKCPVVLSNTSCFPEIAGDAALYFNSKSVQSIRTIIEKIMCDTTTRESLIKKGTERSLDFSWKISTEQTANVYNKLIINNLKFSCPTLHYNRKPL